MPALSLFLNEGTFTAPLRPPMPTQEDERRVQQQCSRWKMATEQWDDLIEDWLDMHIGGERSQVWGIPDTSTNTIADLARQLATPGLYGSRPKVSHPNARNEGLIGPDGYLDRAGYWTRQQHLQFLTGVLDDMFVTFSINGSRELVYQLVLPFNIYQSPSAADPAKPREIWELRLIELRVPGTEDRRVWKYVWHVWDKGERLPDGTTLIEPSYRIYEASGQGTEANATPRSALGMELSGVLLMRPDGTMGPMVGTQGPNAYPWITSEGEPILPFVRYTSQDSGQLWDTWWKRGAMRGALTASLYWSYAGHCARDATGSYVMVAGLEEGASDALIPDSRALTNAAGNGTVRQLRDPSVSVQTKAIEPGTIEHFTIQDDKQPFVHEVSPAVNLAEVVAFAVTFEDRQLSRWGVSPENTFRRSSNPASAASLMISKSGKREAAERVEPIYRRNDSAAYQLAAVTLRIHGIATFDERGYTTVYAKIPKGPDELQQERDEDEWKMEQGLASKVDVHARRNPGMAREAALDDLVRIAVENATLDQRVAQALEAAGLPLLPPPVDEIDDPEPPPEMLEVEDSPTEDEEG